MDFKSDAERIAFCRLKEEIDLADKLKQEETAVEHMRDGLDLVKDQIDFTLRENDFDQDNYMLIGIFYNQLYRIAKIITIFEDATIQIPNTGDSRWFPQQIRLRNGFIDMRKYWILLCQVFANRETELRCVPRTFESIE